MHATSPQPKEPDRPKERKTANRHGWDWPVIISLIVALTGIGTAVAGWVSNSNSIDETQQSQNYNQWETAVGQLSSPLPEIQTGGIGGLDLLAVEAHSPHYTANTIDELSAFIQQRTPSASDCTKNPISRQVRSALMAISELDTTVELGSDADLSKTCLYPVHLHGASLVGVTLANEADSGQGANLYQADLCRANLAHAKAGGGVHFVYANLAGANLTDADFHGADLRDAILDNADVSGANFRGANLAGASLRGINAGDADFTDAAGLSFSNNEPSGPPAC